MEYEFEKTIQGNLLLYIGNYEYIKVSQRGHNVYWRCVHFKKCRGGCRATAKSVVHGRRHRNVELLSSGHNHLADVAMRKVREFKNAIKDLAQKCPNDAPSTIITRLLTHCSDDMLSLLPSTKSITQMIKRIQIPIRRSHIEEPENAHFEINKELLEFKNECFLVGEKSIEKLPNGTDRIILLASSVGLRILFDAKIILFDGTFLASPSGFLQLCTFSASIGGSSEFLPVAFALLTGRSFKIIYELMEMLKEKARNMKKKFHPEKVCTDLDATQAKGIMHSILGTQLFFCQFHLQQAIRKHLQSEKLIPLLSHSVKFCSLVRSFRALSQLPHEFIGEAFDLLKDSAYSYINDESTNHNLNDPEEELEDEEEENELFEEEVYDETESIIPANKPEPLLTDLQIHGIKKLFRWFENFYVKGINGREPQYKPAEWSVFGRLEMNVPTTTNISENFHSRLIILLHRRKPGFYKLTKTLMDVSRLNDVALVEIRQGRTKAANKDSEQRARIVEDVLGRAETFESALELLHELGSALRKKRKLL